MSSLFYKNDTSPLLKKQNNNIAEVTIENIEKIEKSTKETKDKLNKPLPSYKGVTNVYNNYNTYYNNKRQQRRMARQQKSSQQQGSASAGNSQNSTYNYSNYSTAIQNLCATATGFAELQFCEQLRYRDERISQINADSEKHRKQTNIATAMGLGFNIAGLAASIFANRDPKRLELNKNNTGYALAINNLKNAKQAFFEKATGNLYDVNEKLKSFGTNSNTTSLLAANNQLLDNLGKTLPIYDNKLADVYITQGQDLQKVENANAALRNKYSADEAESRMQRNKDILSYLGQMSDTYTENIQSNFNNQVQSEQLKQLYYMNPAYATVPTVKTGGKVKHRYNKHMFAEYNKYC